MKLCIRQKVFSWGDKFDVFDEFGNIRYSVQGEVFTLGKKLHVYDYNGNEVLYIQQKLWSFLQRYFAFAGGRQIAEVVREISFLKQIYTVKGPEWTVNGDFFAHNYNICSGEYLIAAMELKWFTWGDCYVVDFPNPADELTVLAVILIIDCAVAASSNAG